MKIIFEQLGFDYSDVFVQKNGFHYKCGEIKSKNDNFYHYRPDPFRIPHLLEKGIITQEELPTGQEVVIANIRQWKACKGVAFRKKIRRDPLVWN